jgi:ribose-phosphate pyrophosphokinase
MDLTYFKNREESGRNLAKQLSNFRDNKDVIVYGLLRGGVPVAKQIAKELSVSLEPLIVKKIGHPYNPEYAIGAISENEHIVGSQLELEEVDPNWLKEEVQRKKLEIKAQKETFFQGKAPIEPSGKIAIIVDDGVATGFTLGAAIQYLSDKKVQKIVVAVPVIPKEVAITIERKVDKLVASIIPEVFMGAVGNYYEDFRQVSDDEVLKTLNDPIVFSIPMYEYLTDLFVKMPDISRGRYEFERFEDKEAKINLLYNVSGDKCFILSTIMPPDQNLVETFLLAHTLKKEGAKEITWIVPYLSYMRQDKDESGISLAADWIAKLAKISGITKVLTFDIHSKFASSFFDIPIISISPAPLFALEIDEKFLQNATIVAPDEGAIHRCEDLRKELKKDLPIAYFERERHHEEVSSKLFGEITPNIILVDDILASGVTLISACRILKERGVKDIIVLVTHGLFINPLWEDIWEYNVSDIITTNTLPIKKSVKAKGVAYVPLHPY